MLHPVNLMKWCRVSSNHPYLDPVDLFLGASSVCQNSAITDDFLYLSILFASSLASNKPKNVVNVVYLRQ